MLVIAHLLLGISLWLPGFSVWNVGLNTGVQLALPLGVLCVALRLAPGLPRRDPGLLLLVTIWFMGLIATALTSDTPRPSVNSLLVFIANLFLLFGFAVTPAGNAKGLPAFLRGFGLGGLGSAAYAIWQEASLLFGLPFGLPPLNNNSFSLASDSFGVDDDRPFALCPEASVLASLLIPCFVLKMSQLFNSRRPPVGRWFELVVLASGLISCGSMSILISLPAALVLAIVFTRGLRGRLTRTIVLLIGVAALLTMVVIAWAPATERLAKMVDRVSTLSEDLSFITRLSGIVGAWRLFLDNPLLGSGVVPSPTLFAMYLPEWGTQYEVKMGADSILFGVLSGHGAIGAMSLVGVIVLALRRSATLPEIGPMLPGTVVVALMQVGYMTIYHIWIILGIALSMGVIQNKRDSRNQAPETRLRARPVRAT
jgi:hypothetical protein